MVEKYAEQKVPASVASATIADRKGWKQVEITARNEAPRRAYQGTGAKGDKFARRNG